MVHKATHHFDLVNWWLGAMPEAVTAMGKREFYTPAMAKRFGLESHHERCLTCPEKKKCGFYLDMAAQPKMKRLYLDQEKHDGYLRDRCVFRGPSRIAKRAGTARSTEFEPPAGFAFRSLHATLRHAH
jgi:predicted dehydrogenase